MAGFHFFRELSIALDRLFSCKTVSTAPLASGNRSHQQKPPWDCAWRACSASCIVRYASDSHNGHLRARGSFKYFYPSIFSPSQCIASCQKRCARAQAFPRHPHFLGNLPYVPAACGKRIPHRALTSSTKLFPSVRSAHSRFPGKWSAADRSGVECALFFRFGRIIWIPAAAVPLAREKINARRYRSALLPREKASSNCARVSPGNPTMISVVKPISGMASRSFYKRDSVPACTAPIHAAQHFFCPIVVRAVQLRHNVGGRSAWRQSNRPIGLWDAMS